MNSGAPILGLVLQFALLSLISFGGFTAILPEVHRYIVDVQGWMTSAEFGQLFALAQAAPGPNVMAVTLIGYKVAGLSGALAATVAITMPSCLLAYSVGSVWGRWRDTGWGRAVQNGLTPITVGLVLASGWLLTFAAGERWQLHLVTLIATVLVVANRINLIWIIAIAGVAGVLGLV